MPLEVDKYLGKAWKGELLTPMALKVVCLKCTEILIEEENVVQIPAPVALVGDLHG